MLVNFLILIAGLAILVGGAEFLVRGSVDLAKGFKVSPLVIGMTIVAFGTSMPELIVSVKAAIAGSSDIAIGNVVGSNIANLALILGITALIFPIAIDKQSINVDWPMMVFASGLFYFFMLDGNIERWEGVILLLALISFTVWLIGNSKKKNKDAANDETKVKTNTLKATSFVVVGLIGLYFGAEWFVLSSVNIAEILGMSQHIIGVTVVAFGTSVPELVTSAVAAFRKQDDISIGNLIGSNIFNILGVIGLSGIINPMSVSDLVLNFDIFWVIGIALVLFPLMRFGQKITRTKGIFLLLIYVVYVVLLLI
ncbi:MAG: calcium/sodium antiporter [Bacteroidia bacterium]